MQTAENNINTKKEVIKMPLGPQYIVNKIREDLINEIFKTIDAQLKDTLPEHDCRDNSGLISEFYFLFFKDEGLTFEERKYIEGAYVKVGWKSAKYETSEENGEKPGLVRFTLEKP
jgi:hypothetical protein